MKVAIIGAGISGLGAAYLLRQKYDVTVYEKADYAGGHSRTISVKTQDGDIPVDTGFIVFNDRNYPNLTGLFGQLGVVSEKSSMSFGASIGNGWLEYGVGDLKSVFAQRRNLLRPQYLAMIADILRFNKQALRYLEADASISLGQCLDELKMGDWFRRYFLLAMGGAIWSCPIEQMLEFPAQTFIRFFHNHGLLSVNGQPQWYTVKGGSKAYVRLLTASFADRMKLNNGVIAVTPTPQGWSLSDDLGQTEHYDHIVFACHADQALRILRHSSETLTEVLSAFHYQPNKVVLHSDVSFMPQRRGCWSSWVYLSEDRVDHGKAVSLSYWMNNLQPLATKQPLIVTLNPARMPREELVHDIHTFEHPVFDQAAIKAQNALMGWQGKQNLWFCGAYQRYGFHEDGLLSAVEVAKKMGITIPWH